MRIRPRLCQVQRRDLEVRTPGEPVDAVERLLVVRHDRLGDLVLSLPAVDLLRRTYARARLALMVSPRWVELARLVDGVDEVLESSARALADWRPDLLVCISRGLTLPRAAWRARVPCRVGSGRRFYSPLFHRRVEESRRTSARHELEYALSFAHRAGAAALSGSARLSIPEDARTAVENWLGEHRVQQPFVVLHPGSGGSCPTWPVEHYRDLADKLRSEGIAVVTTRGPDVVDAGRGGDSIPCFASSLPELTALLDRARLVVGSSTGPIHLAAALGTKTLALHAPWSSCGFERWGPYHEQGWALVAESDEAVGWSRAERTRRGPALLRALDVEMVLQRLLQISGV